MNKYNIFVRYISISLYFSIVILRYSFWYKLRNSRQQVLLNSWVTLSKLQTWNMKLWFLRSPSPILLGVVDFGATELISRTKVQILTTAVWQQRFLSERVKFSKSFHANKYTKVKKNSKLISTSEYKITQNLWELSHQIN